MRFIPDPDFDSTADGGFYVGVRRSNSSYELLDNLLNADAHGQINRLNYTYSFNVDSSNIIFAVSGINTSQWSNPTQDRVTMQISINQNFNSFAKFKIRYDTN